MTAFVIEILPKTPAFDPVAKGVQAELAAIGADPRHTAVNTSRLFRLEGSLSFEQAAQIASTLLVDPIVEFVHISEEAAPGRKPSKPAPKTPKPPKRRGWIVDVWPKPGVTDPVGETVQKGLKDLGLAQDAVASTATRYNFFKAPDEKTLRLWATRTLGNALIHDIRIRKA